MGRFGFILRRPIELIPVLFGISVVTFILVHSLPGNPAQVLLGPKATQHAIEAINQRYGLDKPIVIQYFYFVINLFEGHVGQSIVYKTSVFTVIGGHILPTLFLVVYSLVFSIVSSIILAVLAALRQGTWIDHLIRGISTVGLGLPPFWIGVLLMIAFGIHLNWFPISGFGTGFFGHLHYLFLPAVTLTLAMMPPLTRNLRASLLHESSADYVTASRSKGMTTRIIWIKHIFANSLLATINLLGVTTSWLIGGTVVVESVFSIPGLGHLLVSSIFRRDYLVVEVVAMILALGIVATNFLIDIATVTLDPRVEL